MVILTTNSICFTKRDNFFHCYLSFGLCLAIHFIHNSSSHAVDPAPEKRPLTQLVHILAPAELYVFAGQYSHSALLVAGENLPAGHTKHAVAPALEYCPAEQVIHAIAPSALYEPAGHAAHTVDDFVAAYLPAWHIVHCEALGADMCPTGHCVHLTAPGVE